MTACNKPVKRSVRARVPHGVVPQIVVTIYPSGMIGLRELRRRREYDVDVGQLYVDCVRREAMRERKERKKARRV